MKRPARRRRAGGARPSPQERAPAARTAPDESERLFRAAFDGALDAMLILDDQGRYVDVNTAACELYSRTREELLASRVGSFTTLDFESKWPIFMKNGQARGEAVLHRPDGTTRYVEFVARARIVPGRHVAILHDFTDRRRAEAELRRLSRAVEQSPASVVITDTLGHIEYVNPKFTAVSGYALDEVRGKNPRILKSGTMPGDVYRDLWATITSGREWRGELHNRKKNGELFWELASISPITDAKGTITHFVAVKEDITEERRVAESAREAEERYRSLFEGMLHGYAQGEMIFEEGEPRDFVYLDVNRAFEELTGLKGVVGRRVSEVIPGVLESSPELFERYGRVARTGVPERFEIYLETLGIWFSISAYSPRKGQFVALFDNITERKRAEEALSKSEHYFRSLIAHALDITAVLEPGGALRYVSPSVERILGYTPEELVGRNVFEIVHPDDRAESEHRLQRSLDSGSRFDQLEVRVRCKDGSWRTLSAIGKPLPPETGMRGLILNARDLTERQQLEAQLRQAMKMEAVGRLAGGIAHDFNNLLTAILGYSDLLASRLGEDDPARGDLDEIRKAGERASMLTRQLLAFSRKQAMRPQTLDLNAVVGGIDNMLRRLIGEDIALSTRLHEELGQVRADPGQVEQIIMNLAVNARDAMPDGGILTIETANVDLSESYATGHPGASVGPHVMLAVSDTGVGMDAETRSHVFEPFFTTKEAGKGTGLGLATIYGIVKQSGGSVFVYSEPGKGTTFKVYLPRVDGAPENPAAEPELRGQPRGETILLVEDEASVRALARQVLLQHGYQVLEAADSQQARIVARDHRGPIHLLLTDTVMPGPGGGGRELEEALSASRPTMKVLFMSGYPDDAIVHHGILDPRRAFLQKPFTPQSLLRKVREVLDAG